MTTSQLHVEVDDATQRRAALALAAEGITVPDAIRFALAKAANDRVFARSLRTPAPAAIEELDCVRLLAAIHTEAGLLPAGTLGAVVYRHGAGQAFEVEFTAPVQAVLTLRSNEVAPLGD